MTTERFNVDLQKFADVTGQELDTVVRRAALEVYDRVTARTPVDTGRARGNWNMGVGSPDLGEDKSFGKSTGSHIGLSTPPTSPKAKKVTLRKGQGKDILFITNNLPYIEVLENGSSTQAPNGMVAVTLAEVEGFMKDVIRG